MKSHLILGVTFAVTLCAEEAFAQTLVSSSQSMEALGASLPILIIAFILSRVLMFLIRKVEPRLPGATIMGVSHFLSLLVLFGIVFLGVQHNGVQSAQGYGEGGLNLMIAFVVMFQLMWLLIDWFRGVPKKIDKKRFDSVGRAEKQT